MPRVAAHRHLPPLVTVCPALAGLPRLDQTAAGIAACLRPVLPGLRQPAESPFYPVRTVSQLAGVSLRTTQRAYQQLAAEGLLRVVRGSQTLVPPRRTVARFVPRGVVGLPIWLDGFARLRYWRGLFVCLETELRRENFVADFVFMSGAEAKRPDLAGRLLEHNLDYVFWLFPLPESREAIRTLTDGGVGVLTAQYADVWRQQPGEYRLAMEPAWSAALHDWRAAGVTAVTVVCDPGETHQEFWSALRRSGLPYTVASHHGELTKLRTARGTGGVAFPHDLANVLVCREQGAEFLALCCRARVLVDQSLPLFLASPSVLVDVVRLDWERLARRLARDLVRLRRHPRWQPATIGSRYLPRVPAVRFADTA